MFTLTCSCGEALEVPESFAGEAAPCAGCGQPLRVVGTPSSSEAVARLAVIAGPEASLDRYFLIGNGPIRVGKLAGSAIHLPGTQVSRTHCQLVRTKLGWRVEDNNSTNGLLVNGNQVSTAELRDGDVLKIGEYELRYVNLAPRDAADGVEAVEDLWADDRGAYELAEPEPTTVAPTPRSVIALAEARLGTAVAAPPPRAIPTGPALPCPCCEKVLAPGAKVCVACGVRVPSGRPLVVSRGIDENDLAIRSDTWIRILSWVLWLGLFPVASEAFGAKRARAIWVLVGVTVLTSLAFLVVNFGEEPYAMRYTNLMLWSGSADNGASIVGAEAGGGQSFHGYQLLTHALLHAGLFHLAGNLVFMIVFGLRVNEAIGDLKTYAIYPLLAMASGFVYLVATANGPLHPLLGASGAIMGLAGMYFVLFPVQYVHMAFWARLGWIFRFQLFYKVFRMRGVWLLALWIAWQDVLPVLLGGQSGDHVAHWAHLGGFLSGTLAALVLLVSRLGDSRGGDLLSVSLGKFAWPLIGKPTRWLEAPVTSAPAIAVKPKWTLMTPR